MNTMFQELPNFNQPLDFDTSSVTDTAFMFNFAEAFNQPLNFHTSRVTNMAGMLYDAHA